ncbi:DNA polymerase [Alteromonas sp. RKMC-009]|uniref:DNA polymerase n=1 Tax=Alteromonas sp. RKMC-009 TaxID=2267264 RepID=UPI000E69BBAD|nr:DNA polymerase [Alteromonas sp. RKMC-009]AYA64279.1 hypothetical protein DS731_09890 [Alteromonas sp. RKMC-009]
MQHIIFRESESYEVALLIKSQSFNDTALRRYYYMPLKDRGFKANIICFDLIYGPKAKCPVSLQKDYLKDLLPILKEQGVKYIYCADGNYFKTLTKERKAEPHHGYCLPCAIEGYTDMQVILGVNHAAMFYNPDLQEKLDMGLDTLASVLKGTYAEIGGNIIHNARYVRDESDVYTVLQELKEYPELTCDTETLSLKFWETGIVTIGFAWDQHNGVVIWCDDYEKANHKIRQLLRGFFFTYRGTLIYHNANYDMKIIINTLFMDNLLDEVGKQQGIEILTRSFHDTKLISYLATNSTAGNKLGLKDQSHEFAGNFAEDVSDIRLLSKEDLEVYQLKDCLSTWYVFNKHFQTLIQDKQLEIYEGIFKPSVKLILQMELTGMPVDMDMVKEARKVLEAKIAECVSVIQGHTDVEQFTYLLREQEMNKANAKLKKKVKPLSDFDYVEFNPNSNPQMQQFFYEYLQYPVVDKTDSGAPATGGDTLMKLYGMTEREDLKELIQTIVDFFDADKILGTFIKAFEGSVLKDDGHYYLHGNFNLGGTVSGRLSSSGP